MNTRHLGISAAALVALLPSIAAATPAKLSLDACVRAFESRLGADGAKYRVNFAKDVDMNAYVYVDASDFTFELAAVNPHSGLVEKRATCSATRGGRILQFAEQPAPKR
jgi:hypothetical protein